MPPKTDWIAYASYDLSDRKDGASAHLAEIYAALGPALQAQLLAMKQAGVRPRTSLGHALRITLGRLGGWPWRDRRRGLLLGMHSLFLAPFFAPGIYVPLDCWSAREAALAAHTPGLRGCARRLYAMAIGLSERTLLRFTARILVVSLEERAAYATRYPHLADRVAVLPLRLPRLADRAAPPPPGPGCSVTVWMDGRVGYGLESIRDALSCLEPWHDLSVTLLTRCTKLDLTLQANQCNLPFAEDLDAFMRSQSLLILPDTFGSGIKNRALEAAARGIPLLATPAALEGLGWIPADRYVLSYHDMGSFQAAMAQFMAQGSTARAQSLLERLALDASNGQAQLRALAWL